MKKETFLKLCFSLGALFAACGVVFQALSEHLAEHVLLQPDGRHFLNNAANILLWHGIALCSLSFYRGFLNPLLHCIACGLMSVGTLLFTVSVTLLSFKMIHHAVLAPWGGSLLILSWLVMASAAFGKTEAFKRQK